MHIGFIAVIASGARQAPGLSAADMLQLYRGKNDECPMGLASVATFPGEIPELYQDLPGSIGASYCTIRKGRHPGQRSDTMPAGRENNARARL
jgi:hypothetical protein